MKNYPLLSILGISLLVFLLWQLPYFGLIQYPLLLLGTWFHEMGHGIHHIFGICKERSVSGIIGVACDVVEFPSEFLEAFLKTTLSLPLKEYVVPDAT